MPELAECSDAELAQLYCANNEQAAAALYQRYASRLYAVARTACSKSFAARFDPEDAVQGAFHELFDRLRKTPENIGADADFWGLLVFLTRNQVMRMVEHHSASKRAVQRTRRTESVFKTTTAPDPKMSDPHGLATVNEYLETLAETDREVVNLRLQGYEVGEIVQQTGRPRRTVERILQHFRTGIAELLEHSPRSPG